MLYNGLILNKIVNYNKILSFRIGGFTMNAQELAWEKFRFSGKVLDYLNYNSIKRGLRPLSSCELCKNTSRGVNSEIGIERNNNKRNRFE